MLRSTLLYLSRKPGLGNFLARYRFTRAQVRRFVPAVTWDEAVPVLDQLQSDGFVTAMTYLGENVTNAEEARAAARVYREAIADVVKRKLRCVPSLKITHVGFDIDEQLCYENVESILEVAKPHGIRVWFDMEGSAYTDRTLDFVRKVRRKWDNIAAVLQAYLYRTEKDLESLIPLGIGVRLCKGCYREPASIAFPKKADVDKNYAKLLERMLSPDAIGAGLYPGIATHDPNLVARARELAIERKIPSDRWEYQMLYGIGTDLRPEIKASAHRLRVLVSYGAAWYGFFMRRLAERPANLMFFLKHAVPAGK